MEEKKSRTLAEIQQEYSQLCMKLGNLVYSQHALKTDADSLLEVLKDLNLEGAAAQKAEQEAKAAETTGA